MNAPVNEQALTNPSSPYAVSKLAFDQHLLLMHRVKSLPVNIIRPSNCYCPGQQLHRIIPKAILSGLTKRKLALHGGGKARKSYLHATDLSKAVLVVIKRGLGGEVYNVGPDTPDSIESVVRRCIEATGALFSEVVEIAPERTGQDSTYWLDSSKVKALGWKQEIGWAEGIADMVHWVKSYPELTELSTEHFMRA